MNTKELIKGIAERMNIPADEVEKLLSGTISVIKQELSEGKNIGISGFGSLEVRKKEERLSVHPATQIRTLIPPKLIVNFKQSTILKDKINDKAQ